jgi:hypothetical protein
LTALAVDEREEVCNLEHILPENPDASWGFDTKDKLAAAHDLVTRIGNLALMKSKVNSKIGNGSFTAKLPHFRAETELTLTADVAQSYKKWGAPEVDARQAKLAKIAVKAWTLKAP